MLFTPDSNLGSSCVETTQASAQGMMFGHALLAQQALVHAIQDPYIAGAAALSGETTEAKALEEGTGVSGTKVTAKVEKGGGGDFGRGGGGRQQQQDEHVTM